MPTPLTPVSTVLLLVLGIGRLLPAQVLMPMELPDPKAQHLQQKHLKTLMEIGNQIETQKFPFPFYFSRTLDIDLQKQALADQRSIRFDSYNGQTVLEITGNYYASYSAERMDPYARLKKTFADIVMPMLRAEVPHFPDDSEFSAFAIEVSHHVRQKAMGVASENPENLTVIIPIEAAQKLVDAKNDDQRQQAILEAHVFLNAQPYSLWLMEGQPTEEWKESNAPLPVMKKPTVEVASTSTNIEVPSAPTVSANLIKTTPAPLRVFTPEALAKLQHQNQDSIDQLVKALDGEAHFFAYAPPSFIGFRQATYLQLSFSTSLKVGPDASRYKQAALAFDEHVSHLIRPALTHLPAEADFDGVDFSSTIKLADGSNNTSVEFFFLLRMMRCFASYDCTGQQLLDSGTIVMNGERATLDLQIAEGRN